MNKNVETYSSYKNYVPSLTKTYKSDNTHIVGDGIYPTIDTEGINKGVPRSTTYEYPGSKRY